MRLLPLVRAHQPFAWVMAAAAAVRVILVLRGGQYFDFDESRYGVGAARLLELLLDGQVSAALDLLAASPDHPGFRVVGLVPAVFHLASAAAVGRPITEMRYPSGEWLPALVLSLASVAIIGLTYAIALRTGASTRTALLASLVLSQSASMLMYARHLFPYDAAMALLLWALWLGLRKEGGGVRSYVAGAIAGLGFLTYTGHWLLAATVGGLHVAQTPRTPVRMVIRSLAFAGGLLTLPGALVLLGATRNRSIVDDMDRFSETATNGDFGEGWSLPWESLWHAEHGLLIVLAVGIALACYRRKGLTWLAAAGVVYGGLVVASNGMHRFVVYDRVSREMLPFLCLAAAYGLAPIVWPPHPTRGRAAALCALVVGLGAANAWPHLTQRFPRDVVQAVLREYGAADVRLDTTFVYAAPASASLFLPPELTAVPFDPLHPSRYVLLNATDLWVHERIARLQPPPDGTVLWTVTHPRALESRQYHGFTPQQRSFLRSIDVSMRLIDTQAR